jgi:hypothetical protein
MRATIIAVLCLAITAADAQQQGHLSLHDRIGIRTAVRAITSAPVLDITPIIEQHPVAGAIPVKEYLAGPIRNHKITNTPIIAYERTDRVDVRTGSDATLTGKSYIVQKGPGGWKVISRGGWIH